MKEITQEIDSYLGTIYPGYKYWGLAEIIQKSADRHPVTVNGREKVGVLDTFDCCVWHRELSGTVDEDEDDSWGLKITRNISITLRTVVAYNIALGEEFKYEFIENFPRSLTIEGFDDIEISPGGIELIYDDVVASESINIRPEKGQICWNIFYFDSVVEFSVCQQTSP